MAKVKKSIAVASAALSSLTLKLTAPGMTALHRAGLGGLACTLDWIERSADRGTLADEFKPGWPWPKGRPPWSVDAISMTLDFGEPENAREFLQRLFAAAFQIRDGLIYLPGQHWQTPHSAVLADLQTGLTLTFLQHGKTRGLGAEPKFASHDDGSGAPGVQVEYRPCAWFKHQTGWQELTDEKTGRLVTKPIEVIGPLNPGAVVRHNAFSGQTKAEDDVERMLPLYFAIVGCLALPVNRGIAALIVPEVTDLLNFTAARPLMTPTATVECQIANAADGALQAQLRLRKNRLQQKARPNKDRLAAHVQLRARSILLTDELPGAIAMTFRATDWASQQKSRVASVVIPAAHHKDESVRSDDNRRLDRFEFALASLPPKIVTRTRVETTGRGKSKQTVERQESFRIDSVVRPLVAENLAVGRPWYAGMVRLFTALDGSGRPVRDRLHFERKGLKDMSQNELLHDHPAETALVQAVHTALRQRYGRIAEDNPNNPNARKKRWQNEYDRWRLAFAGAKTSDQFRRTVCDLFSRGGSNDVLRGAWQSVLPMLDQKHWQLARDLCLLGLASYSRKENAADGDENDEESTN